MKNKNRKRIILITGISLIVLVLVALLYVKFVLSNKSNSNDKDGYDRNIEVLNNNIPTDIVLYGETIPFRDALQYRTVTKIDSEILKTDKSHQIVLLSDLDGTMSISDQELHLIKEKVDAHTSEFYYLGSKQRERLQELGFVDHEWPTDDYCVSIVIFEGKQENFTGIWSESDVQATKDNRETLGLLLVKQFIRVLESNY